MKKMVTVCLFLLCLSLPPVAGAEKAGGGDITFSPKNANEVIFSHEKHVNEKSLKCTNCHYQLFQMSKGAYTMDMSKLTKGDFCGKCHNGQKAFDVKDTKNCVRCHR